MRQQLECEEIISKAKRAGISLEELFRTLLPRMNVRTLGRLLPLHQRIYESRLACISSVYNTLVWGAKCA